MQPSSSQLRRNCSGPDVTIANNVHMTHVNITPNFSSCSAAISIVHWAYDGTKRPTASGAAGISERQTAGSGVGVGHTKVSITPE
jgi:hypothetical protein